MRSIRLFLAILALYFEASLALSQQRAPATPLITHDPQFNVWSFTDALTGSDTTLWTGTAQPRPARGSPLAAAYTVG